VADHRVRWAGVADLRYTRQAAEGRPQAAEHRPWPNPNSFRSVCSSRCGANWRRAWRERWSQPRRGSCPGASHDSLKVGAGRLRRKNFTAPRPCAAAGLPIDEREHDLRSSARKNFSSQLVGRSDRENESFRSRIISDHQPHAIICLIFY
jgi:hypothetical protein